MHHNATQAEKLLGHIRSNYATAKLGFTTYAKVAARDLGFTVSDYHVKTACELLGLPFTHEVQRAQRLAESEARLLARSQAAHERKVKRANLVGRIDAIEAELVATRKELKHLREFVLAMNTELERV